jgi:hypothetical protein
VAKRALIILVVFSSRSVQTTENDASGNRPNRNEPVLVLGVLFIEDELEVLDAGDQKCPSLFEGETVLLLVRQALELGADLRCELA